MATTSSSVSPRKYARAPKSVDSAPAKVKPQRVAGWPSATSASGPNPGVAAAADVTSAETPRWFARDAGETR